MERVATLPDKLDDAFQPPPAARYLHCSSRNQSEAAQPGDERKEQPLVPFVVGNIKKASRACRSGPERPPRALAALLARTFIQQLTEFRGTAGRLAPRGSSVRRPLIKTLATLSGGNETAQLTQTTAAHAQFGRSGLGVGNGVDITIRSATSLKIALGSRSVKDFIRFTVLQTASGPASVSKVHFRPLKNRFRHRAGTLGPATGAPPTTC